MSAQVWAVLLLAGAVASAEALGSPATIEQFPSLAQVEFSNSKSWLQQCAAIIITNGHVLSTATCFYGVDYDPTHRRVRVGSSYRGVDGQVLGVRDVKHHYNFGTLGLDADIAVVSLDSYIALGANAQQAPILGQGIELPSGLVVRHAGWGTTAEGGPVSSDSLYSVDLTVHNNENCLLKYIGQQEVTENMVCVGLSYTSGRDLDTADIGAGVFYSDTLIGLFSFGHENADDDYPAVATSVGSYTSWIIETAF